MATNSYKIVFLIDQCLKNYDIKKLRSIDGLINIVRVCVLKILTYFDNNRRTSSSNRNSRGCENRVEWDVTYFRGTSKRFRDKPRFREFTLKHFEAFENELETRFQALKAAREDYVPQNEPVVGTDDVESDVLDSLKHALRALVHDYSWDRLDIMSPVKLSRSTCTQSHRRKFRKMCPVESEDMKQNFAFVVAECPEDAEDLDISVIDSLGVLRSFLPNDLRQQFVDRLGINLFWVDTRTSEHMVGITSCSCFIVTDILLIIILCTLHRENMCLFIDFACKVVLFYHYLSKNIH